MIGQNQEQNDPVRQKWIQTYGEKNLVGGKSMIYEIDSTNVRFQYLDEFYRQVKNLGFPITITNRDKVLLQAPEGKLTLQSIADLVKSYGGGLNIVSGNAKPVEVDLKKAASGLFEYRFPEQKK